MDFTSWYFILAIGFASGVAVGRLWDEGYCYLRAVYRLVHKGNGTTHPHSEGC